MEIPSGLGEREEWEGIRRMQGREAKGVLVDWLLGLATWYTKADLTFESLAHPERAEKAVRRWLKNVCSEALPFAVVGYERQERGAVHVHLLLAQRIDCDRAIEEWNRIAGWCRIEPVESQAAALEYAVKHAIKDLDVEVVGRPSQQASLL